MPDNVHVIGVRHHSPACARLVRATIRRLRPAYVLIEGGADYNDHLDSLLLGHRLPIAMFSFSTGGDDRRMVWAPLCDYSPEWLALTTAREVGATPLFIDLPAWHRAFADRPNRYSDADERYAAGLSMLCTRYAVVNTDALWDHLVEIPAGDDDVDLSRTNALLDEYFDTLRGSAAGGDYDAERENYMSRWISAARHHASGRPVVVVTGGFHRPALVTALASDTGRHGGWPDIPEPPEGVRVGTYLVPYSYRRLDAFSGYQSGMPSPGYYDMLWRHGAQGAADRLVDAVIARLRERKVAASTADLVAVRMVSYGLAALRGHVSASRTDVLDALASVLVSEDLPVPLPWAARGIVQRGTHPAVMEMLDALTGAATGKLHVDTPLPPLVGYVDDILERLGLEPPRKVTLDLTDADDLARSRALNCLRVLEIPGFTRGAGPSAATKNVTSERWDLTEPDTQLPHIVEVAAYGATLTAATIHLLKERVVAAGTDPDAVGAALFDAVLCGALDTLPDVIGLATNAVRGAHSMAGVGSLLANVLALWRHDWLYQTHQQAEYLELLRMASLRIGWLAESRTAPQRSADLGEVAAIAALRDTLRFAGDAAGLESEVIGALLVRLSDNPQTPPDLRGAGFGALWSLSETTDFIDDPVAVVRRMSRPEVLGDWLTGLFALAREEVLGDTKSSSVLTALDQIVREQSENDFLLALPSLRQAFEYFPPRERAQIADRLLRARGLRATGRSFVRTATDPADLAAAQLLEADVDVALREAGLTP